MGGKQTQQKINKMFFEVYTKQSTRKYPSRLKQTDSKDPFDDLKRRLGIKDDEPTSTSQSVAGTKSLGFIKTKQTTLIPKESGLGFY